MQDEVLQEQFKTAAATSPEVLAELAKLGSWAGYITLEEIKQAWSRLLVPQCVEEALKMKS